MIAAVVLTVGTEGASKLARHGMVLGFGAICGVCACAGCGGDYCGGADCGQLRARASSHATKWSCALVPFVASALAQAAVVIVAVVLTVDSDCGH